MGKLITLLVLLVGGFSIYWFGFHQSDAYKTYLKFSATVKKGNCPELYALVDGNAKLWVDDYCQPKGGMTVMGQTLSGRSAADMVAEMSGSPAYAMRSFKHELLSEDEADDGTVSLVVIEKVGGRPNRNNAPPRQEDVKLKKVGDAWKLMDYASKDLPE